MKLETYLNALMLTQRRITEYVEYTLRQHNYRFRTETVHHSRLHRQYRAFRARILRMDAEKDEYIAELEATLDELRKHWQAGNET